MPSIIVALGSLLICSVPEMDTLIARYKKVSGAFFFLILVNALQARLPDTYVYG